MCSIPSREAEKTWFCVTARQVTASACPLRVSTQSHGGGDCAGQTLISCERVFGVFIWFWFCLLFCCELVEVCAGVGVRGVVSRARRGGGAGGGQEGRRRREGEGKPRGSRTPRPAGRGEGGAAVARTLSCEADTIVPAIEPSAQTTSLCADTDAHSPLRGRGAEVGAGANSGMAGDAARVRQRARLCSGAARHAERSRMSRALGCVARTIQRRADIRTNKCSRRRPRTRRARRRAAPRWAPSCRARRSR